EKGLVFIIDVATGRKVASVEAGPKVKVVSLAVSARHVAAGLSNSTIALFELAPLLAGAPRPARILGSSAFRHGDTVSSLACLPDGRVVSGSWDGTVVVWSPT